MPALLRRPRLESRLEAVRERRLIAVVGGPGSGKSSLLRSWLAGHDHAWLTATPTHGRLATFLSDLMDVLREALPRLGDGSGAIETAAAAGTAEETPERVDAIAGYLCARLEHSLERDLALVIDDLHGLHGTPAVRLVEGLCRGAPRRLHLVLASREEVPFPIDRLSAQGDVARLGGHDLAFDEDEVAAVLADAGVEPAMARWAARAVHEATNGWPATVRLAIEAVHPERDGDGLDLAALRRPTGPLFAYLAREVLDRAPADVGALIRAVAPLERFTPELGVALGVADPELAIRWLTARGLFVQRQGDDLVLHDLLREFASRTWLPAAGEVEHSLTTAAGWYAERGAAGVALELLMRARHWPAVADLIVTSGSAMIGSGAAQQLVAAADRLPAASRSPRLARIVGEACAALGLSDAALSWLERAAAEGGPAAVDVAWRRAMSHYLRDELEQVVEIHARTDTRDADPADVAHLAAWAAGAHRRLGNVEQARELADQALAAAGRTADDRARAAAHIAAAFGAEITGDRVTSSRHLGLALAAAERAGDLLQTARIRINRGSDLLESASYPAAIREFDAALEIAGLAGFVTLQALALMNRGLANWCLGRLEEAQADYVASIDAYRAAGSRELAYALIGRGDVHRERGDLELARAAYEEGLALAERTGDRQALVPALYQSAKVIAADDPDEALARAERAVAYGWPDRAWALTALGWVALARGERPRARTAATEAAAAARASGDRFGAAEALELRAWAAEDPASERDALLEAGRVWRELGNPLREAIVELALARLGTGHGARAQADAAEERLTRLGIRASPVGPAGLLTAAARQPATPIDIRTLGGFRVLRDGDVIRLPEWQSKKARDLLKLLVARRGHPTPREVLIESLWPEEVGEVGNRLSVAVSLLRAVLDPAKQHDAEHFVTTDKANVALNLETAVVDVESFLAHVAAGFDLMRRGRREDALERLRVAEAAYTGDFLEEHPYDDWAVALREEARAAYLAVARALADAARDAGDAEREIRYRLRTLERDPYDEAAHLELIRAHTRRGAHGEARGAYRRYSKRMEEIDVEAAPFPTAAPAHR